MFNLETKDVTKEQLNWLSIYYKIQQLAFLEQWLSWSDIKAAYRLLNEEDVTHQALQESHWSQVFDLAKNRKNPVLFIQDGSVLDYSSREATTGLGPIGHHQGTGVNLHSCLAVSLESHKSL